MKAEAVRRSSHLRAPQNKIAHADAPRESEVGAGAGERPGAEPVPIRDRRDSRWDEHRRARREQLVDAALSAVGRYGAGVGMEEIAAEARTSKTVVYRHFADRSDLHVAVCNRVAEQLLPRLRAAMESGGSPRERTAAAIDTYLAFLEGDPEVYRFVVTQHPVGDPVDPVTTLADLIGDQAAALMAVALERAGRDPVAAGPWGHGIVGLVRSAADWWLRAGHPMLRTELAAHLTDLAWAGLSGVVTPVPNSLEGK
jgi:AcrR family transcriptional regulator